MKITSIRIKKHSQPNSPMIGIASVEFEDILVIHDIKLIQLKDRRIITFPSRKVEKYAVSEDGYKKTFEYSDIVHPSNEEFRKYIEKSIFDIYDVEVGGKK